jgi:hypothetical protein
MDGEPPEKSVMTEALDMDIAEDFIELLNDIDNVTCANLCRQGRLAQQRRGINIASSPASLNRVSNRTQSSDRSDTSWPILQANLVSELTEDPAYRRAEEASELLTQGKQTATKYPPTVLPQTNPPTIGELPFEADSPTHNVANDARRSWRTDENFDLLRQMFEAKRRSREVRAAIAENGHLEEGFEDFGEAFEGRWWM